MPKEKSNINDDITYSEGEYFMKIQRTLNDIVPGERATVCTLYGCGDIRRRLLDIGLVENTSVECLGRSPGGDLSAYLIRGAVIAIRSEDSREIVIKQ